MIEMDGNKGGCDVPRKMNPKKPLEDAHEINLEQFGQETAGQRFNLRIFREIHKVIHIKAKGEMVFRFSTCKIQRVQNRSISRSL